VYHLEIFGAPAMGVLGIHKTTKMKSSFFAYEKKCWLDNPVLDRSKQL
jgi:hypothetical protein